MAETGFSEHLYRRVTVIMISVQGIKWQLTGQGRTDIFLMTVMHTEVTGARGAELSCVITTDQEVETITIMETGLTEMYVDTEIMAVIQDRCIVAVVAAVIPADTVVVVMAAVVILAGTVVAVVTVVANMVAVVTDINDTKKEKPLYMAVFLFGSYKRLNRFDNS